MDAISLKSHDHWEKCGQIAQEEKRIILTRQRHFNQLSEKFQCYAVKENSASDQVEEIFDKFNVLNSPEFIFSRCMKCNNDKFDILTRQELKKAQESNNNHEYKVAAILPSVLEQNEKFYGCKSCKQIYWEGSHWKREMGNK